MSTPPNPISRRSFMKGAALAGGATGMLAAAADPARTHAAAKGKVDLRDKFFGCIAGCHIGSSMGAAVEGWPWTRVQEQYGTLDKLLSYRHYQATSQWQREPGTTEDGVERQKLIITAIIEKKDRVSAEDVRKIWVRDIKPESAGQVSEPFEAELLAMAKSHVPARDIGRYCDYSGLVSFARSCHPIGLINAGDVDGAMADVFEVGQLYQTTNSRGIQWAAVTAVAIAAATRPDATVDGVLGAVLNTCGNVDARFMQDARVSWELDRAIKIGSRCRDFRELRAEFDKIYSGSGTPYAFSSANEVVSKGVAIFKMTNGVTMDAMVAAVNMGRDTDCCASVAAGIAGAFCGAGSIRSELIKQVDDATSLNRFTNSQRTLRETSDGLYEAFQARLARFEKYVNEMKSA